MLQARPVTSVDDIDTEFEVFHESDCGLVGEFDVVTKANVGCVGGEIRRSMNARIDDSSSLGAPNSWVENMKL